MNRFNLRKIDFNNDQEVLDFNRRFIHSEEQGAKYMSHKSGGLNIYGENLAAAACHIIKETMLSAGGEASVHRDLLVNSEAKYAVLMMGSVAKFRILARKMRAQAFGLAQFSAELTALLQAAPARSKRSIPYDGGELVFGNKTLIMGILNCTPDSFSDGGKWYDNAKAVEHALAMEEAGADIIDIGGESTRPGSEQVSAEEEMKRVLPVIEKLQGKLKIPLSIDSYKAVTVRAALAAGAQIINDIWGLRQDPEMAKVGAEYGCPLIIMHNKSEAVYDNFMSEVMASLRYSMEIGIEAGCKKQQFIIDPGFGFGKEAEHNLLITKNLQELSVLDCPILMAASRKKTIGLILDAAAHQRLEGDAAITAIAIAKGADIVRVHDVKEMVKVAKVADAVMGMNY